MPKITVHVFKNDDGTFSVFVTIHNGGLFMDTFKSLNSALVWTLDVLVAYGDMTFSSACQLVNVQRAHDEESVHAVAYAVSQN